MANSCLFTAARAAAALRLPCPKLSGSGDAAGAQVQYAPGFSRPARHRLVAAPVPRSRGLVVTAMVSQEETDVDEEEGVAEQEQGGAVEASLGDASASGAATASTTTTTKLYFGNLPYNCDSAQLAGIVQEYASPEMVEVRVLLSHSNAL